MVSIIPKKPDYFWHYWKPWQEDSKMFDSFLTYTKDLSTQRYGANIIGKYIGQASREQVDAINNLGDSIGMGFSDLTREMKDGFNQVSDSLDNGFNQVTAYLEEGFEQIDNQLNNVNYQLGFLNLNLERKIELQKVTNVLLENISDLLRVPDSEKQRQHHIELGLKFLSNTWKDADLYFDALSEFKAAEELMKQDYFVLHRIGLIYLLAPNITNPNFALEYFIKAAKYASIETDPKATRLVNVLTRNINVANSEIYTNTNLILNLASESYEKAALASYIVGEFDESVKLMEKAEKYLPTPQNKFTIAKYYLRNNQIQEAIVKLDQAIDTLPILIKACFLDIDIINEPKVLALIKDKDDFINYSIEKLIKRLVLTNSKEDISIIGKLKTLLHQSYEKKVEEYRKIKPLIDQNEALLKEMNSLIYNLSKDMDSSRENTLIQILNDSKQEGYDEKLKSFRYISEVLSDNQSLIIKIRELIEEIKVNEYKYVKFEKKELFALINRLMESERLPYADKKNTYVEIKKNVNNAVLKIGDYYQGGFISYLDESGIHGIVFADIIPASANPWAKNYNKIGTKEGIGEGANNTKLILEGATRMNKYGFFTIERELNKIHFDKIKHTLTAAEKCSQLSLFGYSDWYIPSLDELRTFFDNSSVIEHKIFKYNSTKDEKALLLWTSSEKDTFFSSYNHAYYLVCPIKQNARVSDTLKDFCYYWLPARTF